MKLRSFLYALAAGVLVLLLIGAGGFYWLRSQNPLTVVQSGAAQNPAAAMFVPKQAGVMVSLLVNPDRLEEFVSVVAGSSNRGRSREQLDQIKQSLLANTGLNYRQDVQPWLGDEITLAVTTLDIDRNGQNGQQPGYLLAFSTKDPDKSREFVDLFWQKRAIAGTNLVFEQYQGVKLIYSNQPSGVQNSGGNVPSANLSLPNSVASAVVGDRFVLFANNPKVLRDAINNVQAANESVSDERSYQLALQNLSEPRIALSYVNLPALAGWIGNNSGLGSEQRYESLAIALSPKQQGLLAETALCAASGQEIAQDAPALQEPVGALQYIPPTSALALAGTNLNQLWNQLSSGLKSYDTLAQLLNQSVATLEARWGIQLPQEIFSWVQGEYALALLPRPERNNPDWIFVADKSAFSTADEAIEHLDAVARLQGLSVGSLPLENQAISAWTKLTTATASNDGKDKGPVVLNAQVQGVHASAGKYEIFTSSVEAMDRALKAPENSLIASSNFKQAIASLPQSNDGYLYLDWGASQPFFNRVPIFRVVELIGQPFFSNLRSLTFTSVGTQAGVQRSKIFLQIGTAPTSGES